MFITKLKHFQFIIKNNIICMLFSFHIFFWGVTFNFIQLRFLIFLLIFPIFFNFNKIFLSKFLKYLFISLVLFFHLFFQTNTLFSINILSILGLFFILVILDTYKTFFF